MRSALVLLGAATALSVISPGQACAQAQTFSVPVLRTVVGGSGGWDYLVADPASKRLFVSRGDRVDVLDLTSLKLTATIAPTPGVHGVTLAPDRQLGFTSNGRSGSLTVFGLADLRTVDEVKGTGQNPDAIVYDAGSARVFTFGGRSHDAIVVDAVSRHVLGAIALPGKPEFAVVDEKGSVYVNIEDRHSLVRLDAAAMQITANWPLDGCEEPSGLAMDRPHRRLFAVCGNGVMEVVDADSGRVLATVAIGKGPDAVAFDSELGLVLSSNGEGTLSVIRQTDPDHYVNVCTVPTQPGARTMALDPTTHRVYLVTSEFTSPAASAASTRPVPVPGTFSVLTVDLSSLR